MKRKRQKSRFFAIGMLVSFALWTAMLCFVDMGEIGPGGSRVGLATLNGFVHDLLGVHMTLYVITDWLGLVPIAVAIGFAILGLWQWIERKSPLRVDADILALGVLYAVVMAVYVFFEVAVIHHRPVLIEGVLEASYPSSTTVLVLCVMSTAAMQLHARIQNGVLRRCVVIAAVAFAAFMVIGRLLSGVHWVSDIIGGALLSAGLVAGYRSFVCSHA